MRIIKIRAWLPVAGALLLLPVLVSAPSVRAQAVIAQSVENALPLEQTQDGVTLRITKAGFYSTSEAYAGLRSDHLWARSGVSHRPSFIVRYEVLTRNPDGTTSGSAISGPHAPVVSESYYASLRERDDATTTLLRSPAGDVLQTSGGAGRTGGNQQLEWAAVSPYWDHVTLDVEALQPNAPLSARGQAEQVLDFQNVPSPSHFAVPLQVDKTLTATHGTKVNLETITTNFQTEAAGGVTSKLVLDLHWYAPPDVPDMKAELSLESLTDEQGRTQSFKEQGKSFDRSGGHVTLYYDLLDPHKTKKLTIQLRVVEKSPSLRVMKWYRHFQFRLNLPAPSPRSASVSTTLQTAASPGAEGARITLEQLRWFGETSAKQIWQQSYLWLRDRDAAGPSTSDPLAATLEWRLKALTARDADNHSVQVSFVEMGQNAPVTWRSDGVPVAPGESGYFLDFLWDNTRLLPSLTLDATVELVRHWNHNADFPVVPLPSAGHPAAANRPGKNVSSEQNIKPSDPGAGIVLRRIMRVADPDTLSILSAWQRQKVPPGALALLFEVAPRAEKTKLRLRVPWVEDEAGQSWQDSDSIIVVAGSFGASLPPATMTSGPADAQWWTVVLRPQQAPAQHLHIQVAVEETTLQGELRTLSLRDVPTASKPGFRH